MDQSEVRSALMELIVKGATPADIALSLVLNHAQATEFALPDEVEAARDLYASDDIEVGDGACVARADDAVWVAAWVRMPAAELENDEEDGE